MGIEPLEAAAISAVIADLSAWSASTCSVMASSSLTVGSSPAAAATMSGVIAAWCAITVQSAPARTSAVTTSTAPTSAAMWHAQTPRESCALGSAPLSSSAVVSASTVSRLGLDWPHPAISAVRPS